MWRCGVLSHESKRELVGAEEEGVERDVAGELRAQAHEQTTHTCTSITTNHARIIHHPSASRKQEKEEAGFALCACLPTHPVS